MEEGGGVNRSQPDDEYPAKRSVIQLREYTPEEIEAFLKEDQLDDRALEIARSFGIEPDDGSPDQ